MLTEVDILCYMYHVYLWLSVCHEALQHVYRGKVLQLWPPNVFEISKILKLSWSDLRFDHQEAFLGLSISRNWLQCPVVHRHHTLNKKSNTHVQEIFGSGSGCLGLNFVPIWLLIIPGRTVMHWRHTGKVLQLWLTNVWKPLGTWGGGRVVWDWIWSQSTCSTWSN